MACHAHYCSLELNELQCSFSVTVLKMVSSVSSISVLQGTRVGYYIVRVSHDVAK